MTSKLLIEVLEKSSRVTSVRCFHQINLPKGGGGRSSYSGLSATVFGANGQVGRTVTNHLASVGTQLLIPFRGEEKRVLPLKVMADLGQMMFRPWTMKNRENFDEYTRELLQYSNLVLNFIGSNKPYNHYTLEEVNLEWPVRLAQLVAAKNDGTRLIHITNLACNQEEARGMSKLLALQYEAERRMKEIYPYTTIVRSAPVYSARDNFVNLLMHKRWGQIAFVGAVPILHSGGRDTVVQPVYLSDLAKAISTIAKEDACQGQTFEFVGQDRFLLSDMVEYLYNLPSATLEKPFCCLADVIGPMDKSQSKFYHIPGQLFMKYYFRRQYRPALLPKFVDLILKNIGHTNWLSEERFKLLHFSDYLSGGKPGFAELGMTELTDFEQTIYDLFYSKTANPSEYIHFDNAKIPRVSFKDIYGGKIKNEQLIASIQ